MNVRPTSRSAILVSDKQLPVRISTGDLLSARNCEDITVMEEKKNFNLLTEYW